MNTILNMLLKYSFDISGDWGIAIILLTLLIRIIILPISIRQKVSLVQQQNLSRKIEELKVKYKNNKEKLDKELHKCYEENAKNMIGCFTSLLQLPIIGSLYSVIIRMPVESGTVIIPWVSNIKMPDSYFIVSIIYTLVSLSPNLLSYIKCLNNVNQIKTAKLNMLSISIISILITIRTPIAIGIYLITSSFFSLFEEIGYRLYMKSKCIN